MNRILAALTVLAALASPARAENVVKVGFCARTITSAVRGLFNDCASTRAEAMNLIVGSGGSRR